MVIMDHKNHAILPYLLFLAKSIECSYNDMGIGIDRGHL